MLISRNLRRMRGRSGGGREAGYMLLTILLFVTMLVLASAAAIPQIKMRVERDREEELIHRGVQYSRAIKRFYKKFGRYPNTVEELENTNNLRFLRRRYKDPVTGKDFKLLHFGEVQMFAQGVPGLPTAGAANGPGTPGPLVPQATFGGTGPGQMGAVGQAPGAMATAVMNQPAIPNPAATEQAGMTAGAVPGSQPGQPHTSGEQPQAEAQADAANPQQQVFGGSAIVGVASSSPKKTIREFNRKNHYKDWQFVYDPNLDRGGMLTGPAQPPLPGTAAPGVPGQQPVPALPGAPAAQQFPQQPPPQQNPFPQQPPDIQPQQQ